MPSRGTGPEDKPKSGLKKGGVSLEKGQAVCPRVNVGLKQTLRGSPAEEE